MSNPILFLYKYAQCSSTCEGGFKVRKVTCQQVLALGQVLTKTSSQCNPTSRPAESKPCNFAKICSKDEQVPTTTPTTTTSSVATPDLPKIQWTHQNFVQQSQKKKVTLKVGGKATVFKGTQVKIRCPVKHYDKYVAISLTLHLGNVCAGVAVAHTARLLSSFHEDHNFWPFHLKL